MKRIIRLTESDLRGIIKSSVNKLLREFGSDGPDFDEPYGTSDMFQNIGMLPGERANSASDIDDFNPDDMSIYGDDDSSDEDFDIDNSEPYYYGDDSEFDTIDLPESRRRMSRIIKESVNNVLKKKALNEGIKGVDPYNVVPQSVAEKYGFKREYSGFENGLELWGKSIVKRNTFRKSNKWGDKTDMSTRELLRALGISNFTTFTETPYGLMVIITVEPDKTMKNEWGCGKRRRKIGDYVWNK